MTFTGKASEYEIEAGGPEKQVILFVWPNDGVTADLFRSADLFRGNKYASGFVPVFVILSGFVPGVAPPAPRNKWPTQRRRPMINY